MEEFVEELTNNQSTTYDNATLLELCSNLSRSIEDEHVLGVLVNDLIKYLFGPLGIMMITMIIITLIVAISNYFMNNRDNLLRTLRRAPAWEVHRIIEREFNNRFDVNDTPTERLRYPIVTFDDDLVNKKRTVTIVEDLLFPVPMGEQRGSFWLRQRRQTGRSEDEEMSTLLAAPNREDGYQWEMDDRERALSTAREDGGDRASDLPPPYPSGRAQ